MIDTERNRRREYLRAQTARRQARIEGQMQDAQMFGDKKEAARCAAWLKYLQGIQELLMCRNFKEKLSKTVYIAGKISGDAGYKEKFAAAEAKLLERGWRVLNPAKLPDLAYEMYYPINCAMIDGADAIYMLRDWQESPGAVKEFLYSGERGIEILFEREE